MNLINVKLILSREVRDQLRDRRTLFMIFVLPVLLYPLLGVSLSQMMQFRTERPTSVLVIGATDLTEPPLLFDGERFSSELFTDPTRGTNLLVLQFVPKPSVAGSGEKADSREEARQAVQLGRYDAALDFPDDFAQRLEAYRQAIRKQGQPRTGDRQPSGADGAAQLPRPKIVYTTANERSQIAFARLSAVLERWTEEVGKTNLVAGGVPASAVRAVRGRIGRRGRENGLSRGGHLVEDPARVPAHLGHDRSVLPRRGPLRRREGTRHARNPVEQSGRAERNRARQAPHRHGLQLGDRGAEPPQRGVDGLPDFRPHVHFQRSAADGLRLADDCAGARFGPVQRAVPGPGRFRPKYEGRPILPDAPAADHLAAGRGADDAGDRVEPGQQSDSGHRHCAPCCATCWRGPIGRPCNSCRSWRA